MSDGRGPLEMDVRSVRSTGVPPVETAPAELLAEATRLAPIPAPLPAITPGANGHLLAKTFGVSLGLFAVGAIGLQSWEFVLGVLGRNSLAGSALAAALGIATASGVALLLREIIGFQREMRKLREVDALTREAAELLAGQGHGRALPLAARVIEPLRARTDLADAIEHFRRAATTAHSDRQVLELLADSIVRPLDRRAYQAVSRAARDEIGRAHV